jgi:ubiquinone/menaquinone biosynthesis C-methylase UbiE
MKAQRDPEGAELRHLEAACALDGKDVLEIGCGAGWLTWQYAALPRHVVGIDPDAASPGQARSARPASAPQVSFLRAMGEALPFPSRVFDVVLFASSF